MVGIDQARRIFEAARHPKSFVSLDNADHLLLARDSDSTYVAEVLAAWASRYVASSSDSETNGDDQGTIIVRVGSKGFAQEMCRFALYLGSPIHVSSLITDPANSIIHQSFHSHEREEPLNGDGFGLAWYVPELTDEPGPL